jgi:D-alanyl-D-alanine carboxypeptidase (penicillin-binding protein 5/6)
MKVTVAYDQPIAAPVKKGQPLGKVVVAIPNMAPAETPLVAAADVGRLGPLGRIAGVAGHMIWGSWN